MILFRHFHTLPGLEVDTREGRGRGNGSSTAPRFTGALAEQNPAQPVKAASEMVPGAAQLSVKATAKGAVGDGLLLLLAFLAAHSAIAGAIYFGMIWLMGGRR